MTGSILTPVEGASMGESRAVTLSDQARSLWAKSDYGIGEGWLPLYIHSADTCGVAMHLWDAWLPSGVRSTVAASYDGDEEFARKLVAFLAAVHDIGKTTPLFQGRPAGRPGTEEAGLAWKPRKAGLPVNAGLQRRHGPSHPIAGQVILEDYLHRHGCVKTRRIKSITSVIGAHHGRPPMRRDVRDAREDLESLGWDSGSTESWKSVQDELIDFGRAISGCDDDALSRIEGQALPIQVSVLVCGLLIMADWIASNQDYFPLLPLKRRAESPMNPDGSVALSALEARVSAGWERAGIPPSWVGSASSWDNDDAVPFAKRFGLPLDAIPRPVQHAAIVAAQKMGRSGLLIIEAPMGEGKTEAALAAAEILGARAQRGGVCIALPTMATTDAMFSRVRAWLAHLPDANSDESRTVYLAHGKAQLNEDFTGLARYTEEGAAQNAMAPDVSGGVAGESVLVSDWMYGRKKGMLANFVVCTVDQVLMGALDMRHLALRQLSLADKVVVIDECHAYDAYMQCYLERVLEWLGSWGSPVIMLSATLPSDLRRRFTAAYQAGISANKRRRTVRDHRHRSRRIVSKGSPQQAAEDGIDSMLSTGYPRLTYTCEKSVCCVACSPSGRKTSVELTLCRDSEDALADLLDNLLSQGGCAGVVCDTVLRAQLTAQALRARFGDNVVLTHARFTDLDRMENEQQLRGLLGPEATVANGKRPKRLIVVGTQVLEQSLDIDFDVMVTDIAPIDLLLQRMGRLHRHARGAGQSDRPAPLRAARCFIRGIDAFEEAGPSFSRGVESVYARASLMEALSVIALTGFGQVAAVSLPDDIDSLVQRAYGSGNDLVQQSWEEGYAKACEKREREIALKEKRAKPYLLSSVKILAENDETLENLFNVDLDNPALSGRDEVRGQMTVRDSQEAIEVLLLWKDGRKLRLLPWEKDERRGVEAGAVVPTNVRPSDDVARVVSQCAVRLPAEMCRPDMLDDLIDELECISEQFVGAWQDSYWLAGRLILPLERNEEEGSFSTTVGCWWVSYSRIDGLKTYKYQLNK